MKTVLSILFFLVLMLLSLTAFSVQPQQAVPLEKVKLQLKWFHQFQFAGYYAAVEQGYYAQEGLAVELLERSGNKDIVKQVVSGEVEYGVGDSGILSYYAKGEPIVALAAIFQHNPLVFVAKQSSGILSPYEMRGKRVMLDTVNAGAASLRALLAEAGLSEKNYIAVAQSFRNDDLIENKFDVMLAYLSDQPFYFRQKGVRVNVINPQSYGIDFYGDILFTSERELTNHPQRVEKFRRATLKGWQYALAHPEEIIQLIHKKYHSKLTIAHLRFEAGITHKLILPEAIPIGQIDARRLQKVAEVYAQFNLSRPLAETDLARFIYSSHSLILTEEEQAWLKNHPIIYLGIDRDFAPYEWVDSHGRYLGLVADYVALFERRLGVKFAIVKDKSWAEILKMAQAGQVDMIAAAVETPERSHYLTFSKPYISYPVIIINRNNAGFMGSLSQLKGKKVVIEKGYFMWELLKHDYPEIQLLTADNVEDALKQVASKKADAYVGDAVSSNYAMQKLELSNLHFSGNTGYNSAHSVAVIKTHLQLAAIMEKVIAAISPLEKERIKNQWLSATTDHGISREKLLKYGAGVIVFFLIFMGWNIRLHREIKAREQAETLAVKERNLAQQYLDIAGVMLVALNTSGEITLINRKGCEILGYKELQLLKQNWFSFCVAEQDRNTALKLFFQLMDGELGLLTSCECFVLTKTGLQRLIAFHHSIFKDDKGAIIGVLSSGEDVTEQRIAEQQLRSLSVAVEQSPASVVIADLEAKLLYVNPRFTEVTGYSPEEAIGKNPSILQSGLTPLQTYVELWNTLTQGQVWRGELINRRKNGDVYWEDAHIAPVKNTDGTVSRYVGVKIEITERKKAEESLRHAKETAENANRLKSEFLANMSHEIRTPMNAILGFTSILSGLIIDPVQHYYLEAIERGGKTLLQLINDILDLSKIEAGKLNLHYTPVALRALLYDIEIIFSHQIADKHLDFSINITKDLPEYLLLDEVRLRQILLNLVGNAVKFTESGFITITVKAEAGLKEDCVNLSLMICDSGIGIAKEQQETIFLAFTQQAQQSSVYGGTGLGLTICKRLIDLMRGQITVASEQGKGSCFKVSLEEVQIYSQTLLQEDLPLPNFQVLTQKIFEPALILLVDDLEFNRLLIKSYLADFSELTLIEAETGAQALDLIAEQHFDLVLMDRRLPDADGDELCCKIKAFTGYEEVPIIMITASVLAVGEWQQSVSYELQLDKPVKKEQLLAALQWFLKSKDVEPTASENLNTKVPQTKAFQLAELIALLKKDFQTQIKNLSQHEVFYMADFTELSNSLISLGQQYQCEPLFEWANRLKHQTELFDLDNLPKTLTEFNKLIENLSQLQET